MKHYYAIIGAGGHGRETMPLAKAALADRIASGEAELLFVVEGVFAPGQINGSKVISLDAYKHLEGRKFFNVAIANSSARERIASHCLELSMEPFSIVAQNSIVLDNTLIGIGCILSPFTAVTSNVRIGKFFHANNFSNIAHDCVIGDFVTFGPGVKCNGNVHIGDHALIGAGAVLKQGSSEKPMLIGRGAVVGMGAVVTKDVLPNTTVAGNPARLIKHR